MNKEFRKKIKVTERPAMTLSICRSVIPELHPGSRTDNFQTAPSRRLNRRGFTLIELMVASTIFIIVMVISIGAVLSIVDANRKAQSLNDIITNLNFSVESMVRDLREGTNYCGGASSCVGQSIDFIDSQGRPITYALRSASPCPADAQGVFTPCITKSVNGVESSFTSTGVIIENLNFSVKQTSTIQPTILVSIQGRAGVSIKTQSDFQLQTLVTQRILGLQVPVSQ